MEECRSRRSILKSCNSTFIALIPKVRDPSRFDQYTPIALCNTIYKVVAKAMATTLKKCLENVISNELSGFLKNRQILDGVLIAQEVIHSIQNKKKDGMVIKLDMNKAYDRVSWEFLISIMRRLGFCDSWCKWVFSCISSTSFAVLVNGVPTDFFNASKGLCQGDPLSPFLFLMLAEVLSRSVQDRVSKGDIKGLQVSGGISNITHLQFVDDTLLLGEATAKEAHAFKKILVQYEKVSGQKVNETKSQIFFLKPRSLERFEIQRILGYNINQLASKHLGLPLVVRKPSLTEWSGVISRINGMLDSWKGRWLSVAGRITLIKAAMSVVPVYTMSVFQIPKKVAKIIEDTKRSFLWKGCNDKFKYNLIKWDDVCKPVECGGQAIRKSLEMNMALGAKLVWRIYEEKEKLWSKVLQANYLQNNVEFLFDKEIALPPGSSIWLFLCHCRKMILPDLRWHLGDGSRIRFWKDKWLDSRILADCPRFRPEVSHFEDSIGDKARDYMVGLPPNRSWGKIQAPVPDLSQFCAGIQRDIAMAFIGPKW
ncbi:hypothetical protein SUGI_0808320 [Cryptomeria japonica]|nr:hypothetical protein SUGI_0808320 [Cryptomeria japonica]